jgi:hypothetical protein
VTVADTSKDAREPFSRFMSKFSPDAPSDGNSYRVYADAWKFDFDKISEAEILHIIDRDPRPLWCSETFTNFSKMTVAELGPADGYNTAGLERLGAKRVIAVEGNVDAFLRCLILKNALNLRAKFFLGDFNRLFEVSELKHDLLYASGVLYHLPDPLKFIEDASQNSKNLFLWTHFYDQESVDKIENESYCFRDKITEVRSFRGRQVTYHRRVYDTDHVASAGYIGGLKEAASWISREDLFAALDLCGYEIKKVVEDPFAPGRMPAVNILATKR